MTRMSSTRGMIRRLPQSNVSWYLLQTVARHVSTLVRYPRQVRDTISPGTFDVRLFPFSARYNGPKDSRSSIPSTTNHQLATTNLLATIWVRLRTILVTTRNQARTLKSYPNCVSLEFCRAVHCINFNFPASIFFHLTFSTIRPLKLDKEDGKYLSDRIGTRGKEE
ncbi:hypothetical protein KQX54_018035 [Cotesia glomerata]|uniref:Uncharacterized protein n=1 Tax=Cotesia glomerata TaxID=32391 RepID=A0AAV7HY84_COTGL|nr:hypothetical protein KQX54_018035 [Cotesia glomerata]